MGPSELVISVGFSCKLKSPCSQAWMTEQALSIAHPDPFRLLPAHHTAHTKLLEPTVPQQPFHNSSGSFITRQHLIAMTVTGHTLRYGFQAKHQFGSFQHNLDKALPLQMHPGQDHSGLVAQLGMVHGVPGQCATVSLSSPQILHAFLPAPGGQQLAKRGSHYRNRAAHALCQPLLSGRRGCLLVWYSIQADPSDNQAISVAEKEIAQTDENYDTGCKTKALGILPCQPWKVVCLKLHQPGVDVGPILLSSCT